MTACVEKTGAAVATAVETGTAVAANEGTAVGAKLGKAAVAETVGTAAEKTGTVWVMTVGATEKGAAMTGATCGWRYTGAAWR